MNNDPTCEVCKNRLSKGGIFIPSLDPFYIMIKDEKDSNSFQTTAYHAALDFFLKEVSDDEENIIEQKFYHVECAPDEMIHLLPPKEEISKFLYSGNVGTDMQVQISIEKAKKDRIPGKKK